MNKSEDNLLERYLLGDLAEAQRTAMEDRLFADREIFEQMWARENQLVDDYVRDRLTGSQRERFESHYLASPVHQRRVLAARYLLATADRGVEPRLSFVQQFVQSLRSFGAPQIALTAAVILLAVGTIWLFKERSRLREEVAILKIENAARSTTTPIVERDKTTPIVPSTPEVSRTSQPPRVFAFTLSPISVRSGEGQSIALPRDVETLRLKLNKPSGDWTNFSAAISHVGGRQMWTGRDLRAREGGITIDVPATRLSNDDYILTLSGVSAGRSEEVERYSFRVSRK